jgi:phosphopantetheinyl transferase (holo-ACP synthase)
MLGNDLIDLQKAAQDSNWQRKGFLDKVFSQEEKHKILNSENPSTLVWLFWSMKESAYKIINRETGLRFYSPTAFTCKNRVQGQISMGEVYYNGKIYHTQSNITEKIIHTIALSVSNLVGSVEPTRLPFNEVEVVYLANNSSYIKAFNSISNTYELTKNESGIPELIHRKTGAKQFASVSHHGKFLAVVSLPNLNN